MLIIRLVIVNTSFKNRTGTRDMKSRRKERERDKEIKDEFHTSGFLGLYGGCVRVRGRATPDTDGERERGVSLSMYHVCVSPVIMPVLPQSQHSTPAPGPQVGFYGRPGQSTQG
jgi:hypothetical protein